MINAAVRHIIEPELAEGEALLWAETVDKVQVDAFVKNDVLCNKLWAPIMFITSIIMAYMGFSQFIFEFENVIDLIQKVIGTAVVLGISFLIFLCALEMVRTEKHKDYYEYYNKLIGYGLTYNRFFIVEGKAAIKAIHVKNPKLWKRVKRRSIFGKIISNSIIIDHDDNYAGIQPNELKFLSNAEQTYQYLEALIGKTK